MPRVASCPQCEHELLVPEGANADAWATCPECKAFFELKGVKARELPALLLVDSESTASEAPSAPTVSEFPPITTPLSDLPPSVETAATESGTDHPAEPAPVFQFGDEHHEAEPHTPDSPEVAAQRIDAWFRSAKTLNDLPQSISGGPDQNEEPAVEPQPVTLADSSATLESDVDVASSETRNSDFELEMPPELPPETAAWDDSQHMERLLADLENQPVDSLERGSEDATTPADEQPSQPDGDWSADVPLSVPIGTDTPRPKRSIVRAMVFTVFGGVVGLGLGYYVLLWLGALLHRGPEIDFLDVAKYLPKAVLPATFRAEEKPVAKASSSAPSSTDMIADLAASAKTSESKPTTTSAPPEKKATPEKQTAFTAPDVSTKPNTNELSDGRYGTPGKTTEAPPHEPAKLETPQAAPLTETKSPEPARIADAPSFAAGQLTTALQAANEALPALVAGNLADGQEVAHAKGTSYMTIADMAQKATFVEPSASPDAKQLQRRVDEFFRNTLSNDHTRNEVAQIAPKWLSHSPRPQNGVFFAGTVTHQERKGSVDECSVDLGGGQSITVLMPAAAGTEFNGSSRPVGVAGWIVEKPSEQVAGYTGSASQAVFAQRLIPLE